MSNLKLKNDGSTKGNCDMFGVMCHPMHTHKTKKTTQST